jgi:hypothetical protein
MQTMPRTGPILNFVVRPEFLRRLDKFWHENEFPSRAAAVKWLLEAGLDAGLRPEPQHDR